MQAVVPVSVVLCTYNGARYLPEQLASIEAQTLGIDRLVLRDDGSTDDSVAIVRRWAIRTGTALHVLDTGGRRLGPAASFLTALARSEPAGIHLLCDQDDVWLPDKVERSSNAVSRSSQPALYASTLQIVDSELHPLRLSQTPRALSFTSAACESLLTGCTMALNEPLRLLIPAHSPSAVAMHDWWIYLLASAVGTIDFDSMPTVLYRQHGSNAVGAGPTGWRHFKVRWKEFGRARCRVRSSQLRAFADLHGRLLNDRDRKTIDALLARSESSCVSPWRAAWYAPVVRQRQMDRWTTRLSLLTNRF
jgi:glycosyltransferase involved in cell wall biosynthesis